MSVRGVRINLIGGSGSGTSTLGAQLADILDCLHIEADALHHLPTDPPYREQRDPDERAELLREHTRREAWVLSGGVMDWGVEIDATHVIWLTPPHETRMSRLKSREIERLGSRIEPEGEMHMDHLEFMRWASAYEAGGVDGKTLARHAAWFETLDVPKMRISEDVALESVLDFICGR